MRVGWIKNIDSSCFLLNMEDKDVGECAFVKKKSVILQIEIKACKVMVKVDCVNTATTMEVLSGTSLQDIANKYDVACRERPLCALVNNTLKELSYQVYNRRQVKFLDIHDEQGAFVYMRTLNIILYRAVRELFPECSLEILNALNKRNYFEINGLPKDLDKVEVAKMLARKMQLLIDADIPLKREKLRSEDVIKMFTDSNEMDRVKLIETSHKLYTSVFTIENERNFYFGYVAPSTGYIDYFEIHGYRDGFVILGSHPSYIPIASSKIFTVFHEHMNWIEVLGVPYVGDLNESISNGRISDLIKISEGLQEKKIASIADKIAERGHDCKIVLVAGPSSSGKTTFTHRVAVQLMVNGYKPFYIGMDDYFVERNNTPLDENGEPDFESLGAIDLDLFNSNLKDLIDGKEVTLPKFNFKTGSREWQAKSSQISDDHIILIEGIHALNPALLKNIDDSIKFKIFIAPLAQLSLDSQNPIDVFDNRLIRRMVRDARTRGHDATRTLELWEKVRNGEDKNIFPYKDIADVQFNSALVYELAALKPLAIRALIGVKEDREEHAEALRLIKLLSFFEPVSDLEIPPTSILREFLGGSSFVY